MAFLGLDVGGTRCRYEWWPGDGRSGGAAAGVQPAVVGPEAAADVLAPILQAAGRPADSDGAGSTTAAVLAIAGAGDPALATALRERLADRGVEFPVAVVGDVVAAAAAGLRAGPGVLVWAGTGSFAVARGEDGSIHRVGGRGYLLGDQGSGFDLVRRAGAAALLGFDAIGQQTVLGEQLARAFDVARPERLGAAMQELDTGAVAARLPIVLDAAAAGDAVANGVLAAGADALAALASAAAKAVDLQPHGTNVTLGGGVLAGGAAIRDRLTERLASSGFSVGRPLEDNAAACGAAWLAAGNHDGLEPQRSWVTRVAL